MASTAQPAAARRSLIAALDVFSVGSFALLWSWVAAGWAGSQLASAGQGGHELLAALVAMPLGVLAADFATGCAHWFADRFFEEETTLLDRLDFFGRLERGLRSALPGWRLGSSA